jgi:outer membrane protein assembly factor BamB
MKKLFLIFLSIQLVGVLWGQTKNRLSDGNDTIVGTSFKTGIPVMAKCYIAPLSIYQWHWNGTSENLLLELRETNKKGTSFTKKGMLSMIELESKGEKWSREMNYNSSRIVQQGDYFFLNDVKKNILLDPETGNSLWEGRLDFYYIEPQMNIGLGYPIESTSNKMTAMNLSTGVKLWDKTLDRTYGWDDAYMLNDSILLIEVNGIHAINLLNGKEWSYNAKTVKKEIGKMIGFNIVGLIVGALTDSYFYQNQPDVATSLSSNLLIDPDGCILYASRDKIARINTKGKVLWSSSLPEKKSSTSSLILIDSVVYLINRGYAQYNGEPSKMGDPYLAAFSWKDGNQLYLNAIPEKNEYIRHYQVINDILFLLFKDKVATFKLSDGLFIREAKLALQKNEEMDAFLQPEGIFLKQDDMHFFDMAVDYGNYNLIRSSNGRIIVMNDSLEMIDELSKEKIFFTVIANPEQAIITQNDSDFVVLDAKNGVQMVFKASENMFLYEDQLYFIDKDRLFEIDLNQLN